MPDDEELLTTSIVSLASEYGRYGYRRITTLLRGDGWRVNHKRVERMLASGGAEGARQTAASAVDCGSMTVPASGSDRSTATTFELTTSYSIGPRKGGP